MLPPGADIFDSHLHLGTDIDGMVGDYDQLEEVMSEYGISRAFVFCLDEPDRHPSFSAANDRTLAYAERSGGRLVPFVRLDLNESPIDLLDLYRRVPPEQVVYASDFPYGQQPSSLFIALRTAFCAGLSEEQIRLMLAESCNRLADGRPLPEPTKPVGSAILERPMQLARIHQYLSMALPLLWLRQP